MHLVTIIIIHGSLSFWQILSFKTNNVAIYCLFFYSRYSFTFKSRLEYSHSEALGGVWLTSDAHPSGTNGVLLKTFLDGFNRPRCMKFREEIP